MYNEDTVKDVHKDDHEVFWRWFYVSNWGSLRTAPRKDYQKHIAQGLSFYGAEFWEKACVEVIVDNDVWRYEAKDLKKHLG